MPFTLRPPPTLTLPGFLFAKKTLRSWRFSDHPSTPSFPNRLQNRPLPQLNKCMAWRFHLGICPRPNNDNTSPCHCPTCVNGER